MAKHGRPNKCKVARPYRLLAIDRNTTNPLTKTPPVEAQDGMEKKQLDMFEAVPQSDWPKSDSSEWELVKRGFTFKYHLFRVDDGRLSHVNTLFKNYNDSGYPPPGHRERNVVYTRTDNAQEIIDLIVTQNPDIKYQYVYTQLDLRKIQELSPYYTYYQD